ncbi:hypothetical protein HRbin36_00622 [bacterium HR36]|nr:hypothetical protein HRbin36_00622 [bacterium HR36]
MELPATFDVVVVVQQPAYGQSLVGDPKGQVYRRNVSLLLRFAREGDGLCITHDADIDPQR